MGSFVSVCVSTVFHFITTSIHTHTSTHISHTVATGNFLGSGSVSVFSIVVLSCSYDLPFYLLYSELLHWAGQSCSWGSHLDTHVRLPAWPGVMLLLCIEENIYLWSFQRLYLAPFVTEPSQGSEQKLWPGTIWDSALASCIHHTGLSLSTNTAQHLLLLTVQCVHAQQSTPTILLSQVREGYRFEPI